MTLTDWKAALIAQYGAHGVRFERHAGTDIVRAIVARALVGTFNIKTNRYSMEMGT
jgi:hypothetical protein